MKRPFVLTLLALAPPLAAAVSPYPYYESGGDYSPYLGEYHAQSLPIEPYPRGYASPYQGAEREASGDRRRETRPWVKVPDATPVQDYASGTPLGAYPGDDGYRWGPGLYEQFATPYGALPPVQPFGERAPAPVAPPLPPEGRQAYRFRGDEAYGADAWGGTFREGGYRFRPLSDQELDRLQGDVPPWRPLAPYEPPPLRLEAPGGGPDEEAYGYQPDSWFRRYYGERP